MSRSTLRVTLFAFAALMFAWPAKVSAWTEAQVESARALVTVDRDAHAVVDMTLRVQVHGGWLEGLEVAGLDPDLSLTSNLEMRSEDGDRYEPTVDVRSGGRVLLRFRRRGAPRRGVYEVRFSYQTELAHRATEPTDDGAIRVSWTLPGWRTGLDGVEIAINAPRGAELPRDTTEELSSVVHGREDEAESVTHRWRRAHLPRTIPWTVSLDVPADQMNEALRGAEELIEPPRATQVVETVVAARGESPWLIALLVIGVAVLKRALVRGGLSPWSGLLAVAGLALAGVAAHRQLDLTALIALAASWWLQVPLPRQTTLAAGTWRAAREEDTKSDPLEWLDATTLPGVVTLAALLLGTLWFARQDPSAIQERVALASLLLTGTFFTAGRHSRPSSARRAFASLAQAARTEGLTKLAAAVHVDKRGRVQDARLRIVTRSRPDGLARFDLALMQRRSFFGFAGEPRVVVVTDEDSEADALAREVLGDIAERTTNGRWLRVAPVAAARTLRARFDAELGSAETAQAIAAEPPARAPSSLATIV